MIGSQEHSLSEINNLLPAVIDVFVCSASFENRCLAIPKSLDRRRIHKRLIAVNENNLSFVGPNSRKLKQLFGDNYVCVALDTDVATVTLSSLSRAISDVVTEKSQVFVVDITTFTREALLILFILLKRHTKEHDKIFFVYNGAAEYSIGDEQENKWLSKGIRDVRSVIGFPGVVLPTRKIHLIILVGFEFERAGELIDRYEPALISLGYGYEDASITPAHYSANREFFERLFRSKVETQYGKDLRQFQFSPRDPIQTMEAIFMEMNKSENFNTIIAPMNTKLSTLGAAIAASKDDSIQLCYAQAEIYNVERYSTAKDSFYLLSFDKFNEPQS